MKVIVFGRTGCREGEGEEVMSDEGESPKEVDIIVTWTVWG